MPVSDEDCPLSLVLLFPLSSLRALLIRPLSASRVNELEGYSVCVTDSVCVRACLCVRVTEDRTGVEKSVAPGPPRCAELWIGPRQI